MPNARKRESGRVAAAQPISTMRTTRKAPERRGNMRRVTATGSKTPRNNGTTHNRIERSPGYTRKLRNSRSRSR